MEIVDILVKVAAVMLSAAIFAICKKAHSWLSNKLDEQEMEKLDAFVDQLVAAADQMYKEDDPDGSARLSYVEGMLIEAGYDLTDAVRALIESHVFKINNGGIVL